MTSCRASVKTNRELVLALESARTRLAVAIASETKTTPPERRQYYLDTADRMRRLLKNVRSGSGTMKERREWIRVLEALRRLPAQTRALQFCQVIQPLIKDP